MTQNIYKLIESLQIDVGGTILKASDSNEKMYRDDDGKYVIIRMIHGRPTPIRVSPEDFISHIESQPGVDGSKFKVKNGQQIRTLGKEMAVVDSLIKAGRVDEATQMSNAIEEQVKTAGEQQQAGVTPPAAAGKPSSRPYSPEEAKQVREDYFSGNKDASDAREYANQLFESYATSRYGSMDVHDKEWQDEKNKLLAAHGGKEIQYHDKDTGDVDTVKGYVDDYINKVLSANNVSPEAHNNPMWGYLHAWGAATKHALSKRLSGESVPADLSFDDVVKEMSENPQIMRDYFEDRYIKPIKGKDDKDTAKLQANKRREMLGAYAQLSVTGLNALKGQMARQDSGSARALRTSFDNIQNSVNSRIDEIKDADSPIDFEPNTPIAGHMGGSDHALPDSFNDSEARGIHRYIGDASSAHGLNVERTHQAVNHTLNRMFNQLEPGQQQSAYRALTHGTSGLEAAHSAGFLTGHNGVASPDPSQPSRSSKDYADELRGAIAQTPAAMSGGHDEAVKHARRLASLYGQFSGALHAETTQAKRPLGYDKKGADAETARKEFLKNLGVASQDSDVQGKGVKYLSGMDDALDTDPQNSAQRHLIDAKQLGTYGGSSKPAATGPANASGLGADVKNNANVNASPSQGKVNDLMSHLGQLGEGQDTIARNLISHAVNNGLQANAEQNPDGSARITFSNPNAKNEKVYNYNTLEVRDGQLHLGEGNHSNSTYSQQASFSSRPAAHGDVMSMRSNLGLPRGSVAALAKHNEKFQNGDTSKKSPLITSNRSVPLSSFIDEAHALGGKVGASSDYVQVRGNNGTSVRIDQHGRVSHVDAQGAATTVGDINSFGNEAFHQKLHNLISQQTEQPAANQAQPQPDPKPQVSSSNAAPQIDMSFDTPQESAQAQPSVSETRGENGGSVNEAQSHNSTTHTVEGQEHLDQTQEGSNAHTVNGAGEATPVDASEVQPQQKPDYSMDMHFVPKEVQDLPTEDILDTGPKANVVSGFKPKVNAGVPDSGVDALNTMPKNNDSVVDIKQPAQSEGYFPAQNEGYKGQSPDKTPLETTQPNNGMQVPASGLQGNNKVGNFGDKLSPRETPQNFMDADQSQPKNTATSTPVDRLESRAAMSKEMPNKRTSMNDGVTDPINIMESRAELGKNQPAKRINDNDSSNAAGFNASQDGFDKSNTAKEQDKQGAETLAAFPQEKTAFDKTTSGADKRVGTKDYSQMSHHELAEHHAKLAEDIENEPDEVKKNDIKLEYNNVADALNKHIDDAAVGDGNDIADRSLSNVRAHKYDDAVTDSRTIGSSYVPNGTSAAPKVDADNWSGEKPAHNLNNGPANTANTDAVANSGGELFDKNKNQPTRVSGFKPTNNGKSNNTNTVEGKQLDKTQNEKDFSRDVRPTENATDSQIAKLANRHQELAQQIKNETDPAKKVEQIKQYNTLADALDRTNNGNGAKAHRMPTFSDESDKGTERFVEGVMGNMNDSYTPNRSTNGAVTTTPKTAIRQDKNFSNSNSGYAATPSSPVMGKNDAADKPTQTAPNEGGVQFGNKPFPAKTTASHMDNKTSMESSATSNKDWFNEKVNPKVDANDTLQDAINSDTNKVRGSIFSGSKSQGANKEVPKVSKPLKENIAESYQGSTPEDKSNGSIAKPQAPEPFDMSFEQKGEEQQTPVVEEQPSPTAEEQTETTPVAEEQPEINPVSEEQTSPDTDVQAAEVETSPEEPSNTPEEASTSEQSEEITPNPAKEDDFEELSPEGAEEDNYDEVAPTSEEKDTQKESTAPAEETKSQPQIAATEHPHKDAHASIGATGNEVSALDKHFPSDKYDVEHSDSGSPMLSYKDKSGDVSHFVARDEDTGKLNKIDAGTGEVSSIEDEPEVQPEQENEAAQEPVESSTAQEESPEVVSTGEEEVTPSQEEPEEVSNEELAPEEPEQVEETPSVESSPEEEASEETVEQTSPESDFEEIEPENASEPEDVQQETTTESEPEVQPESNKPAETETTSVQENTPEPKQEPVVENPAASNDIDPKHKRLLDGLFDAEHDSNKRIAKLKEGKGLRRDIHSFLSDSLLRENPRLSPNKAKGVVTSYLDTHRKDHMDELENIHAEAMGRGKAKSEKTTTTTQEAEPKQTPVQPEVKAETPAVKEEVKTEPTKTPAAVETTSVESPSEAPKVEPEKKTDDSSNKQADALLQHFNGDDHGEAVQVMHQLVKDGTGRFLNGGFALGDMRSNGMRVTKDEDGNLQLITKQGRKTATSPVKSVDDIHAAIKNIKPDHTSPTNEATADNPQVEQPTQPTSNEVTKEPETQANVESETKPEVNEQSNNSQTQTEEPQVTETPKVRGRPRNRSTSQPTTEESPTSKPTENNSASTESVAPASGTQTTETQSNSPVTNSQPATTAPPVRANVGTPRGSKGPKVEGTPEEVSSAWVDNDTVKVNPELGQSVKQLTNSVQGAVSHNQGDSAYAVTTKNGGKVLFTKRPEGGVMARIEGANRSGSASVLMTQPEHVQDVMNALNSAKDADGNYDVGKVRELFGSSRDITEGTLNHKFQTKLANYWGDDSHPEIAEGSPHAELRNMLKSEGIKAERDGTRGGIIGDRNGNHLHLSGRPDGSIQVSGIKHFDSGEDTLSSHNKTYTLPADASEEQRKGFMDAMRGFIKDGEDPDIFNQSLAPKSTEEDDDEVDESDIGESNSPYKGKRTAAQIAEMHKDSDPSEFADAAVDHLMQTNPTEYPNFKKTKEAILNEHNKLKKPSEPEVASKQVEQPKPQVAAPTPAPTPADQDTMSDEEHSAIATELGAKNLGKHITGAFGQLRTALPNSKPGLSANRKKITLKHNGGSFDVEPIQSSSGKVTYNVTNRNMSGSAAVAHPSIASVLEHIKAGNAYKRGQRIQQNDEASKARANAEASKGDDIVKSVIVGFKPKTRNVIQSFKPKV